MSDDHLFGAGRKPFAPWLVQPMLKNRAAYTKVAVAAVLINIFGIVSSIFTMTVYDRVLPNNAIASLVGLSIGMAIVIVFDLLLRTLRAYFVDVAGVNVDRSIGEKAFERLIAMRMASRRGSTGALAGTMRELETLRDFFASASLVALVDVPFIFLTLAIIALIGGWMVLIPLAALPIVILAGFLTFPAMDRLATEAMNQGLTKQGVLVETIGGLETIKAIGASNLLKKRWLAAIDSFSVMAIRQRLIATISVNLANAATTIAYTGSIVLGVFLIESRDLTVGGLIACSLLGSRAIAPLTQIAQLLSRLAATRSAYRTLRPFMEQDSELDRTGMLRPTALTGLIEFRNVSFRYPGAKEDALNGINLIIRPGEKVGILGRIGSGKSTLARLALGLYDPTDGIVLLDGTDIRQIEPAVLRAHVGAVLQDNVLISGSIRDNILLDRPNLDDEEMLRVARLTGTHDFIGRIANGYDLQMADRGESLSGGQRQSIALARALAGSPDILIMDEPTSGMDQMSEQFLMQRLAGEFGPRTVAIITHRVSLLRLVERVIIVADGKIQLDGPRDQVLRQISQPAAAA
ncbi:type I secretion system permease/ATPase [Altererythrobacter sp. TH136]|uniref:type I secretion system permease/ATPase n=1 Tax=Altererythrobacter sp. TH136 TaxID=2067415 RepID=UPI0011639440|nr:type I secretion system permease/ATPase [Altererythrobacter sp. TH136]QDM41009.1 type I secretion system permease/ATPase [Altererythrobacter sp. TH136]